RTFTFVGALAFDPLQLSSAACETPRTVSTLDHAVLQCRGALYPHIHLIAVGHSTDDVAVPLALVAVDLIEIRAGVLLRLGSGDLHGFGPGAPAFADHERVAGMVAYFERMLFV